jgi:hypothetical protein
MKVADLQPRQQIGEFVGGGIHGDAVREVEAPIADDGVRAQSALGEQPIEGLEGLPGYMVVSV